MARDDVDLAFYLERWTSLNSKGGTLDRFYAYWILGKGAEKHGPRWSVMRNVLGWGEGE